VAGAAAPSVEPQKTFGLPPQRVVKQEIAAGTRAADASKIEAHISQLAQAPNGRTVFTLDNDQVWRELTAGADLLAKPGESVTISRGLLGSFWLETEHGRGCKVTRVR
jgi:D-lyxose ketol-isomerase